MKLQIFGPGCRRCRTLAEHAEIAVKELGIECEIEKVDNIEEIAAVLANTEVLVPWERCSRRLAIATDSERQAAELSPGGYGVHWSLLDEDITIRGLVQSVETS